MNTCVSAVWLKGLMLIWLLALPAPPSSAAIVFDDHFEGNSGGIPAGWLGEGEGSVVEAGTTVTFHDDFVIATNEDLDPNEAERTTLRNRIASTTNHTHVGLIDYPELNNHFWIKLYAEDGKIEVKAADIASGEEEYVVGYVTGYTGGAIELTVTLDTETFSVSTDSPAFSSGPINYSSVFTSFSRADLGNVAKLVLENECSPYGPPCTSVYDRVTMEVGSPTAAASTTWGHIKRIYHDRD